MKHSFLDITVKLLLGCALLLSASACTVPVSPAQEPVPAGGSFRLFLQPLPQEVHRLSFTLGDVAALRVDGGEVPLPLRQTRFQADELIDVQQELANLTLPPGRYRGIALRVLSTELLGEEGQVDLLPAEKRLVLEHAFTIRDQQAETLFLSLSADRIITDGVLFTPRLSLWTPQRILINLKGFVSNSGTHSLTVFNKRAAEVHGSIQVGATPAGLALDQRRGWLYAALTNENAIAVVEVNTGALLGRVQLRFGDRPGELALTANGDLLLALNPGSSSLSIIDTRALFETGRVRLEAEPNDIFLDSADSRAYVIHTDSNLLSVVDLQSHSVSRTAVLDEAPLDGLADVDGQSLYLINDFSAELTVLDAASLTRKRDIHVGNGATSIKADRTSGLLYVGMENGRIAVVDPRSAMAIDAYALPPEPVRALTIDHEENALFAVLPQTGRLLKIDLVSKQLLGQLQLESGAHAVVVMGER
jgi:DNA-binding beta-propeller fold protein YncE